MEAVHRVDTPFLNSTIMQVSNKFSLTYMDNLPPGYDRLNGSEIKFYKVYLIRVKRNQFVLL